jgi:hypothetical protein
MPKSNSTVLLTARLQRGVGRLFATSFYLWKVGCGKPDGEGNCSRRQRSNNMDLF